MSGPYQRSIAAYRDNRVSGAIEDADPHRLVALLLSGARERLNLAWPRPSCTTGTWRRKAA